MTLGKLLKLSELFSLNFRMLYASMSWWGLGWLVYVKLLAPGRGEEMDILPGFIGSVLASHSLDEGRITRSNRSSDC
jgi:hypothetical protein